ncbi:MAG: DUF1844 domain-containing protein [Candidatus Eremiobacteraeota bacterium]|nr:DUF1844 domain-containing protein [Candidatus Eremiobacteraeota bacterium]
MATEPTATAPNAPAVPPVEVVMSEVVASLALAAHAYLHPSATEEGASPDLGAAEIAIDVAGKAFERIGPRLGAGERSAMASMLTDLRFTYVKKRGP